MIAALLIMFFYVVVIWLVFFKFKWLRFTMTWAALSSFVFVHVLFVFMVGLRFVTPYSTDARIIQHTIQLVPRLTEPTLVTEVLVQPDVPVKKGAPLFRFDRRPYIYRVQKLMAQLAQARQNVKVLHADMEIAKHKLDKSTSESVFARYQQDLLTKLAANGGGSVARGGWRVDRARHGALAAGPLGRVRPDTAAAAGAVGAQRRRAYPAAWRQACRTARIDPLFQKQTQRAVDTTCCVFFLRFRQFVSG